MAEAAFVYEAIRTPRGKGKRDGTLHEVKPVRLLADLLVDLQKRTDIDTSRVEDVIMGCVSPVGEQGAVIAKTAASVAGYDTAVPGVQLNRFCASGLEAVNIAAQKVASGWEDMVVAGGVESMSRVPMFSDGGAWVTDPQTNIDLGFVPQGIGADLIATIEGFSRDDVDEFAVKSQAKAAAAQSEGRFDRSVVPVKDANGLTILARDEFLKPGTDMQKLGALKPAFDMPGKLGYDAVALMRYPDVERIDHVHTAGNSSGIVDGAATVLIGNEAMAREQNLTPRARIVSVAITATDPTIMLLGPAPASRKALAKAGLKPEDIDLYEVNEAFASVVMKFMKELDVPEEKVNVCGGAIALGHPLGATGAMILNTLVDELEARKLKRGLATMCVGGGMGIATIIERV